MNVIHFLLFAYQQRLYQIQHVCLLQVLMMMEVVLLVDGWWMTGIRACLACALDVHGRTCLHTMTVLFLLGVSHSSMSVFRNLHGVCPSGLRCRYS